MGPGAYGFFPGQGGPIQDTMNFVQDPTMSVFFIELIRVAKEQPTTTLMYINHRRQSRDDGDT